MQLNLLTPRRDDTAKRQNADKTAIILRALKNGAHLTSMDALALCGCWRLDARIRDLRKQGYPIVSKTLKTATRQCVVVHHLPK